jgi:hypothetical protein
VEFVASYSDVKAVCILLQASLPVRVNMFEPNNGQGLRPPCPNTRPTPKTLNVITRADYEQFCLNLFHLACNYGLRPAARILRIPEDRARKIASRRKWNIGPLSPALKTNRLNGGTESPQVTTGIEVAKAAIEHYGTRAKIGAVIAGSKVFEHLADKPPSALIAPATAIAADQWGKVTDRAAGWTAARTQGVQVAVQVNLPTQEEDDARMATDDRLDEIARLLKKHTATREEPA